MSDSSRHSDSNEEDEMVTSLKSAAEKRSLWGTSCLQSSSSDSEDLEVVEASGTPQSTSFERTNSQGDESPYHISSNFYNQSYDSYHRQAEEPTYSLEDPTNGNGTTSDNLHSSSFTSNTSRKSSKKKKSSRNDSVPSSRKTSKRKHKTDEYSPHSTPSKRVQSFHSDESDDNKNSETPTHSYEVNQMSYYEASHSEGFSKSDFPKTIKSPPPLPDLSEEEDEELPKFGRYGNKKMEDKSTKSQERTDIKKRLDSSNKGNILMQKMGYKEGEGLGKRSEGRTEPVELSKQKGRRGLGHSLPGIDDSTAPEWDPSLEELSVREHIDWLENYESNILDYESMIESWLVEGPKNLDLGSMTDFVDEEILNTILQKKSVFDNLSEEELQRTILRSNPFESIRKGIFMNRAAVKMANIDSAFDFIFTDPKFQDNSPMVGESELLYFADVCAGPGGFSEYILWRKKWRAKGIGFTLKGDCDFKIHDFQAGPSESFEPYYGIHDDGNIYDPDNLHSLTDFVMKVTENQGVHFMMADGGFSVKGQENIQELLSKQLYLCQFLVALSIVRTDGHFVCKLFDLFSPFSVGLIYLIYQAFDKICIFKPNTSRPANSERYIVCKHKKRDVDEIRQYLFEVNERMWKLGTASDIDINEIVPLSIIKENSVFFNYIRDSNNRLGNRQIISLDKVIAYFKDPNLHEPQQNSLRKQCMETWKIPLGPRRVDQSSDIEVTRNILKDVFSEKYKPELVTETLNIKGVKLVPEKLKELFNFSILDWECVPLGSEKLVFLLGLGKNRVYQWLGSRWDHEDKLNMELPPGTLVWGEYVSEYIGEGMRQKKITAFHIVDGISLGYEIISNYHYNKRVSILNLFASSLRKYGNSQLCPIRVKSPREMKDIEKIFSSLVRVAMKSGTYETCLQSQEYSHVLQMKGICFIRTTRDVWRKHLSKSTKLYYYYNNVNKKSLFEHDRPQEAIATAIDSLKSRVLWMWEAGVGFKGEPSVEGVLHKNDLLEFIRHKL